ncbi:uncharacterized protein [Drosophila kikkawai]|uniref:NADH dehydrogenase [ubiquinone] 1 beta subcomplex subunit 6 n=1 Tax=Drosophila kikkawai TaxID=30033 RepID=A0ABM3C742_DROKI|nr:uncharacterized protein LOC108085691 [Drosophila kikkawai]XP_041632342.1 uncharacterized protein LOC121502704 [Drosophila kikkawai]
MVGSSMVSVAATAPEVENLALVLKDQELHHGRRKVPALKLELNNPIKRFYRAPLNKVCNILTPVLGFQRACTVRFWTGKALLALTGIYAGAYYFKYNQKDLTRKGGWRVIFCCKGCVPGDEEYPKVSDRSAPSDYAARGFKQSPYRLQIVVHLA